MNRLATIAALVVGAAACATAPKTVEEKRGLEAEAAATIDTMLAKDAELKTLMDQSAGYVVFPQIGKGGAIVGAAYGRGVLFEGGRPTGFVELNQGSIGAQLGGQTFAEMIVFQDAGDVQRLKSGKFEIGGNASAVVLKEGASANVNFEDGVAVFTMPLGGLMAELSVSGQQLNYQPRDRG